MKNIIAITLTGAWLAVAGCASTPSLSVSTASTEQLLARRAAIERQIHDDNFGVAWGMTRWISHAAERDSVLKERQAIDSELARRHVAPPKIATFDPSEPLKP